MNQITFIEEGGFTLESCSQPHCIAEDCDLSIDQQSLADALSEVNWFANNITENMLVTSADKICRSSDCETDTLGVVSTPVNNKVVHIRAESKTHINAAALRYATRRGTRAGSHVLAKNMELEDYPFSDSMIETLRNVAGEILAGNELNRDGLARFRRQFEDQELVEEIYGCEQDFDELYEEAQRNNWHIKLSLTRDGMISRKFLLPSSKKSALAAVVFRDASRGLSAHDQCLADLYLSVHPGIIKRRNVSTGKVDYGPETWLGRLGHQIYFGSADLWNRLTYKKLAVPTAPLQ